MANIKHYTPCGTCGQMWASAHLVYVGGADRHCQNCAPEVAKAFDNMMGNPIRALDRLSVSGH